MNARADAVRFARAAATPPIADVAVLGGGIVGAAAALAAAQAGLSTTWVVGRQGSMHETMSAVRQTASAAFAPASPGLAAQRSSSATPASRPAFASPTFTPQTTASPSNPSHTSPTRDPRVYALSPGSQRLLERLRVWPSIDPQRATPVLDMRVYGDADGRAALHFGAFEAATERLATIVEHGELARVLETAASYFPAIERIDGLASQLSPEPDHIGFATDRGPRLARLVIAADGARSPTREALGIPTRGRSYGQRAIVGNFACARPHAGAACQWFTDDGVIALLPLAAADDAVDAYSLVWSAPDAVADALLRDGADAIAARLSALVAAQRTGDIGPLTPLGPLTSVPLAVETADRLVGPRVALVGDAAHVIHPLAGQGLNLGLADVDTLIATLVDRESFRDCGDAVLLRRYERARAEPVRAMRGITDGLSRLFAHRRSDVAALRGLGMRLLDHNAPLKRLLMRRASGTT